MNKITLKDICLLVTDGTHDSPTIIDTGMPLIKAKEISKGNIDFENCDYISKDDYRDVIRRVKPQKNDILFSNIASIGDIARVGNFTDFAIKNVALFRPNPRKVNVDFFYYFVGSYNFRTGLLNYQAGSAQPYITLDAFRRYKFILDINLDTQNKIASLLSPYDEIININRRRIQLLEKAARLLYREWFVYFRFPGHEKVKVVDGVPEDWKKENIFSIADVNYGKNLPTNKFTEKGEYPVYGAAKIIGKFNKYTKEKRTIITGCRGSVGQVTITRPKSYITNNSFTFEPKNLEIFYWLYFSLGVRGFGDVISGTAQPQITLSSLSRIKLVSPNVKVIKDFELKAANYFNLIFTLEDQNQKLVQARDLLLPRLMNGTIEVSEFDIKTPQEAET